MGSFFGYDEITVTAEVTGRVAKVYHDVGDIVRPGDVLMELDKTDLELDLEQTRRVLGVGRDPGWVSTSRTNHSRLAEIAVRMRAFDIEKLPSWIRAEQLREVASSRFERAKQLFQANAMSKEEFQQRTSEYDVAESAFHQATYDARAAFAAIQHRVVLLRIALRQLELATIRVPTPTQREYDARTGAICDRQSQGHRRRDAQGRPRLVHGDF